MPRNEAQTRYELIDPALRRRGWNETNVKVEETTGGIVVIDGKARRRKGRTDYLLRLEVSKDTQPVAIALIEAKAEDKSPGFGLSQGKRDGDCDRLNVKFIFSTNGHQYVEYDKFTSITSQPKLPCLVIHSCRRFLCPIVGKIGRIKTERSAKNSWMENSALTLNL